MAIPSLREAEEKSSLMKTTPFLISAMP